MSRPMLGAMCIGAGLLWLLLINPVAVLGLVAGFMVLWTFRT